jgi:hypothetical protein
MTTTAAAVNGTGPEAALTRAGVEAARAQVAAAPAPVAQYATGFDGAAAAPFPAEAVAVLGAPVAEDEVELRDDGIVFMPGVWYRRQLSRAFGPGAWALLPRGPSRRDGEIVMYHGGLYILGRFVSEAMGECEARWGMTYASALEGARTDCLSRCCKDLGMAAELWDKSWRDGWQAKYAVKEWKEGKDGKKGRYWFSRVGAKKGVALVEGRNAGGPDAPKAAAAEAPAEALASCEFCGVALPAPGRVRGCCSAAARADADRAVADTVAATKAAPADTGEAPSDDEIMELQRAAVSLGWKAPIAKKWLKRHFGVDAANALTARQCADALELLKAAAVEDMDATYGQVFDRLVAEGRVRR